MRYTHANGFNKKSMQELKGDVIDVMYFCAIVMKKADTSEILTYEALNYDAATALTYIGALDNGLITEEDMMNSMIKFITSFHAASMMIIDTDVLFGEDYERFYAAMYVNDV